MYTIMCTGKCRTLPEDLIRIGEKLISPEKLHRIIEQILEQRQSDAFSVFLSGAIDRYKKNKRIRLSAKAQGPGMPGM